MIKLLVSWNQRISLWARLGIAQVSNLKEASNYIKLLDKLAPTDQEKIDTKWKIGNQQIETELPYENYGTKEIDLTLDESDAFIKAMENSNVPFSVREASWILPLIDDIKEQKDLVLFVEKK